MTSTTTKPPIIAIIGASGKLGGATLRALLEHDLHPASRVVALTSSQPGSGTWERLAASTHSSSKPSSQDTIQVRHATFDDPATLAAALSGVDVLFLISTPRISMDFGDAPPGQGREKHHFAAIDAAVAAGVRKVVYSSLAFGFPSFLAATSAGGSDDNGGTGKVLGGGGTGGSDVLGSTSSSGSSKAGVMRAHLRTEAYLARLRASGALQSTVLRAGLYNESWPLYMGYFDIPRYLSSAYGAGSPTGKGEEEDQKEEKEGEEKMLTVKLAGDGRISWTAIKDLGTGCAVVLASLAAVVTAGISESRSESEFSGKTFYLSTPAAQALSLSDLANLITTTAAAAVAQRNAKQTLPKVNIQVVSVQEHVDTYTSRQGEGSRPAVEWWVSTYAALEDGECLVDDPTLGRLLDRVGVKATPMAASVKAMLSQNNA